MELSSFQKRMETVQKRMEAAGIGCFLTGPSSTMKYLTGYSGKPDERLFVLVMAAGKKPFVVANQLYALQASVIPTDDFVYWADGENGVEVLCRELERRGTDISSVAVDKSMPGMFLVPLMERLQGARLILGNSLVDDLRIYKDSSEMEAMMMACRLASEALEETVARGTWWIGKTETEFMGQLAFEMTKRGLKLPSGIVAVGANAAVPHHLTGQTVIETGKCLLVDFGGNYKNYNTDMMRTIHFGEPTDEFKQVYEIVLEANRRGKLAAKAGNQLQDVDRAARNYIESQGYGPYFTHRTGHGIGIDGHEGPSAGEGETTPIAAGMAFSVEPGIYLPGKFGVRIEDQILITETETKVLHDFQRELVVIK